MCGILLQVLSNGLKPDVSSTLCKHLKQRGPDNHFGEYLSIGNHELYVFVSVLYQRSFVKQPFRLDNGSMLLYNGEIYDIPEISDTRYLAHIFNNRTDNDSLEANLRRLNGEFSCIFIDQENLKLFIFRDKFGRKSLLLNNQNNQLIISSVASIETDKWYEMQTGCLFVLDLNERNLKFCIQQHNPKLTPVSNELQLKSEEFSFQVAKLSMALQQAVALRLPIDESETIAILFSGGIDSLLLAKFAAQVRPQTRIDLLSVAFGYGQDDFKDCIDRKTAISSFKNLRKFGYHNIHLIEINVTKTRYEAEENYIKSLIFPSDTVLDLSIGAVLYYASRGTGIDQDSQTVYTTDARVMLFGSGADELFAGYSRHRTAYQNGGFSLLATELQLDIDRFWIRNCGRDDRVLSDSGREARMPFLDEAVYELAISMPLNYKLHINTDGSFRTKAVLRELAIHLNLLDESETPKRACQFGSGFVKITKNSDRKAGHLKL